MVKRLKVEAHWSAEELENRSRRAPDGVERSPWQSMGLLVWGKPTEAVAAVTGDGVQWIRQLARRYNGAGTAGIGNLRRQNAGTALSVDGEQPTELTAAMDGPAPDGGVDGAEGGKLDEGA